MNNVFPDLTDDDRNEVLDDAIEAGLFVEFQVPGDLSRRIMVPTAKMRQQMGIPKSVALKDEQDAIKEARDAGFLRVFPARFTR